MAIKESRTTTVDLVSQGERKPPLTQMNILVMTLGFFGNSFGFGIVFSAVNPLFTFIGAHPEDLPILNIAGPITGLLVQPLIGAFSDKMWSDKYGRRKPFIYGGAFLAAVVLIIFPFVGVLWAAVVCLWLLDIGNNTTAEPYRAFLADRLPKSQLARGFLTQSFYAGLGSVLANLCIFALQKFITGQGSNGLPYWMYACFWLGTVSIVITVIIAMTRGPREISPDPEELAEIRAAPQGLGAAVKDISSAVRTMPVAMHKIGAVFFSSGTRCSSIGSSSPSVWVRRCSTRIPRPVGHAGRRRCRGQDWSMPRTTSSRWLPRCS